MLHRFQCVIGTSRATRIAVAVRCKCRRQERASILHVAARCAAIRAAKTDQEADRDPGYRTRCRPGPTASRLHRAQSPSARCRPVPIAPAAGCCKASIRSAAQRKNPAAAGKQAGSAGLLDVQAGSRSGTSRVPVSAAARPPASTSTPGGSDPASVPSRRRRSSDKLPVCAWAADR